MQFDPQVGGSGSHHAGQLAVAEDADFRRRGNLSTHSPPLCGTVPGIALITTPGTGTVTVGTGDLSRLVSSG